MDWTYHLGADGDSGDTLHRRRNHSVLSDRRDMEVVTGDNLSYRVHHTCDECRQKGLKNFAKADCPGETVLVCMNGPHDDGVEVQYKDMTLFRNYKGITEKVLHAKAS